MKLVEDLKSFGMECNVQYLVLFLNANEKFKVRGKYYFICSCFDVSELSKLRFEDIDKGVEDSLRLVPAYEKMQNILERDSEGFKPNQSFIFTSNRDNKISVKRITEDEILLGHIYESMERALIEYRTNYELGLGRLRDLRDKHVEVCTDYFVDTKSLLDSSVTCLEIGSFNDCSLDSLIKFKEYLKDDILVRLDKLIDKKSNVDRIEDSSLFKD